MSTQVSPRTTPAGPAEPTEAGPGSAARTGRRSLLLPWVVVPLAVLAGYLVLPPAAELRAQYQASALVLVAAPLLAWLLTRAVDAPVRRSRWLEARPWRALVAVAASVALVAGAAGAFGESSVVLAEAAGLHRAWAEHRAEVAVLMGRLGQGEAGEGSALTRPYRVVHSARVRPRGSTMAAKSSVEKGSSRKKS